MFSFRRQSLVTLMYSVVFSGNILIVCKLWYIDHNIITTWLYLWNNQDCNWCENDLGLSISNYFSVSWQVYGNFLEFGELVKPAS